MPNIDGKHTKFHEMICPGCGADLAADDSVTVEFSNGNCVTHQAYSSLAKNGHLLDTTGEIAIGLHSSSNCTECGEMLDELEEPLFDNTQAVAEGWDLFDVNGRLALQREDVPVDAAGNDLPPKFATDADAIIFVALKAHEGSAYHRDALERIGTEAD